MGTPIRITRRIIVRSMVIRLYNCVIQYNGCLKTVASQDGRYNKKQMVLLLFLIKFCQGFSFEETQKYEGRDVLESSLVSSRSKGGLAR